MAVATAEFLEQLGATLNAMPGTFSTPQWGGRAYKTGSPTKSKLLAFVALTKQRDAVTVSFKLERDRAEAVIERHAWIDRHSFRTLGGSGWVTATIDRRSQVRTVARLLAESRALYPEHVAPAADPPAGRTAHGRSKDAAQRIDEVMGDAARSGWRPGEDW